MVKQPYFYPIWFSLMLFCHTEWKLPFFDFTIQKTIKKMSFKRQHYQFFGPLLIFIYSLFFRNTFASLLNVDVEYVTYAIWILVFDALVIIPFSKLRAEQRPMKYAVIKIGNVLLICFLMFSFWYFTEIIHKESRRILENFLFRKLSNWLYFHCEFNGKFSSLFLFYAKLFSS